MIKQSQIFQEDHSQAKIQLYSKYVNVYMQIATKARFKRVLLFDPFCGEGEYLNGVKGSPLVSVEAVKTAFYSNNKSGPPVSLKLNDNGNSKIEKGVKIIDRVKRLIGAKSVPPNLDVIYTDFDYQSLIPTIQSDINSMKYFERGLMFIDPYGYKMIKVSDLESLLKNQKIEILLFLPMTNIYRFIKPTMRSKDFPGGQHIKRLLEELSINAEDLGSDIVSFINLCKQKLKRATSVKFLDSFTLETKDSNFYCLFFFTNNQKGFQKMLEQKWAMDESSGKGFRPFQNTAQISLFSPTVTTGYQFQLEQLLVKGTTNEEIFYFGLENGHLPKHSREVLDLNKDKLTIESLDGKKQKGYYINDASRKIKIKLTR